MGTPVTTLAGETAARVAVPWQGFELVPRTRVAFVRDEAHALELLGRERTILGEPSADLHEVARALARGELLLVHRDEDVPLDPPDPHAVPLLSDLAPDGGDPIAREPERSVETWFEIALVDGFEVPLAGVEVRVSCDGDTHRLTTDDGGRVRVDGARAHVAMLSVPPTKELEAALRDAAKRPLTDTRLESGPELDVVVFETRPIGPLRIDAETPHTLSIQRPTPAVHILELAALAFFEDREVLLPDVEVLPSDEPGPDRVPAINVVAKAVEFLAQHPSKHVLVVGHTDTVGKKGDNVELSQERAKNVHLYLAGDRDGWAAHCDQHHEVEDVQRILRWAAVTFPGFEGCDPGAIDDDMGPQTRDAIQALRDAFEAAFGEKVAGGDDVGVADWKAYARLYDEAVAVELGDAAVLESVRSSARFTDPPAVGFGERHPTENPGSDDLDSERNRRVEIVFFDEPELELFADESSIEQHLYGDGTLVERHWLAVGFAARSDELKVRVIFEDGVPVSGETCTLTLPDGDVRQATVDADGFALFSGLPRSACEFRLPELEAFDWDADEDGPRELPEPPIEEDEEELVAPEFELTEEQRRVLDDTPLEEDL